jgi:hypothetical protein
LAEAKIAAQHASLALKNPDDLAAMKLHAGHVLHALDPSVEAKGPGLGFGVKRASEGAAQHIELAAKTDGASANVKTHSTHIAGAANSAARRAAEAVALAQKVRAAAAAAEAAALMKELSAAVDGIAAGIDGNQGWPRELGGSRRRAEPGDTAPRVPPKGRSAVTRAPARAAGPFSRWPAVAARGQT